MALKKKKERTQKKKEGILKISIVMILILFPESIYFL